MVLRAQLLRAESVCLHDFLGQGARLEEAVGVETDLSNGNVLGHHHSHRTEQGLQVVWQGRPACIAGIHRDENVARVLDTDLDSFESELAVVLCLADLDFEDLLCDDGENLKFDTIELIEARPTAT